MRTFALRMKHLCTLIWILAALIMARCTEQEPGHEGISGNRMQDQVSASPGAPGGKNYSLANPDPPAHPGRKSKDTRVHKGTGDILSLQRTPDTLLIQKLEMIRALEIEPDINEPVTRRYLFSPVGNSSFRSMITLSHDKYFRIQGDNDILNNTDRFYTNGLRFDLILPAFSSSPLSRLLVPYWREGINYYGLSIVQNMYTPSTTKLGGILYGDRPYAAYLYIGSFKITNDLNRRVRLSSELQLGVIGSASLGEFVQKWFHNTVPTNNEPLGWQYQIQNDLLLNYLVSIEKGILATPHAEVNLFGSGSLGTVYTELNAGAYFRVGVFNPYFRTLGFCKRSVNLRQGLRNTQAWFFVRVAGSGVGYDATLQGGMFNHTSPYVIPYAELARVQFKGSAGLAFSTGGFQVFAEQFLQSPEFLNGWWHKWMSIGFTFAL
jgi:lipid A 3-O-deacylase